MSNFEIRALAKVKIKGNLGVVWKGLGLWFFLDIVLGMLVEYPFDVDTIITKRAIITMIGILFVLSPLYYGTMD